MQFTERELTLAVQGAARMVAKAQAKDKRAPDEIWESLTKYQRYQLLEPVSTQILPVFAALPEVDVAPGTRASFTTAQLTAAIEEAGVAGQGGWVRRKAALAGQLVLVKTALDAMPPREDPDKFVVPDHL